MSIGRDEVVSLARLARLDLAPGEREQLARDLSGILAHVARLGAAEEAHAAPPREAAEASPLRDDQPHPAERREEVLRSGPVVEDGLFVVPRVIRSP